MGAKDQKSLLEILLKDSHIVHWLILYTNDDPCQVEPISKLSVLELKEANQEIKWLEMEVNAEGEALWLPLEKGGKPSAGSNYTEKSSEDANKILSKGLSTLEDEICLDEVEWICSLGSAHKSLNTSFFA